MQNWLELPISHTVSSADFFSFCNRIFFNETGILRFSIYKNYVFTYLSLVQTLLNNEQYFKIPRSVWIVVSILRAFEVLSLRHQNLVAAFIYFDNLRIKTQIRKSDRQNSCNRELSMYRRYINPRQIRRHRWRRGRSYRRRSTSIAVPSVPTADRRGGRRLRIVRGSAGASSSSLAQQNTPMLFSADRRQVARASPQWGVRRVIANRRF